jgi:hypothetical protein
MKPRAWSVALSPRRVALATLLAALSVATAARATPNFPGAIKDKLSAVAAPECAICHVSGRVGGRGTVNTPFGAAMRARGLVLYDEASLGTALAQIEKDGIDSDGDGTIDVDAVRMGKNPNPSSDVPMYGCVGRVSPAAPTDSGLPALGILVLLAAAMIRRRGMAALPNLQHSVLITAVMLAAVAGCALPRSGVALAPRSGSVPPTPPRMAALQVSAMGDDLRAAGLDPSNLPAFEALTSRQVRRVMGTFTRSLGYACTDCHEQQDYRAPTRAKRLAARMWNDMVRPNAFEGSGALYCDSCHQGQGRFLDRSDKKAIAAYMSDNYTEKLKRGPEKKDVECETCHGDPMDPSFLAKW